MAKHRITYRNWATDSAGALSDRQDGDSAPSDSAESISAHVRAAIEKLEPAERLLVERYYLRFEDLSAIADSMQLTPARMETVHRSAMKRLIKLLGAYVEERFGINSLPREQCLICLSPRRSEIDHLIATRDPKRPWRILLRKLRAEFGINIRSCQTIKSHQRYH